MLSESAGRKKCLELLKTARLKGRVKKKKKLAVIETDAKNRLSGDNAWRTHSDKVSTKSR